MEIIVEQPTAEVDSACNAVPTARREPSELNEETAEMAGFFRSLSQRLRSNNPAPQRQSRNANPPASAQPPKVDHRREFLVKVHLLDGTDIYVVLPKKAFGQQLYDYIFNKLDLEERDYFGLQYTDHYQVQHWLDPLKKIVKQDPVGPPYSFKFRIKFYSSEPMNLREELTRYQFFLQLKLDVQSGRLSCPKDMAVDLAAYALQSELGDYNPREHDVIVVSEFRFHPEQDEEMEAAILEKYKTFRGQTPATAEMNYLNRVKWLDLYGVDMHRVAGKDGNDYQLGLTPTGVLVFDGNQKIGLFFWEKLQKLDFRGRKLTLVVEEDADRNNTGQIQLHTFVFELPSHKACKHLWKCAIEHHTFFRLKFHRPPKQNKVQLFRLGSTFKYRGRTEYENVHREDKLPRRTGSTFERRPSQRYVPRQSYLQKQKFRQDMRQQAMRAANAAAANSTTDGAKISEPASLHPSTATDAVLSPEVRLDNLIAGPNGNLPQLHFSPSSNRRIGTNSCYPYVAHPPPAPAPSMASTVIGIQKPATATPYPPPPPGGHVTTIEINEKGANVYAGNQHATASATAAPSVQASSCHMSALDPLTNQMQYGLGGFNESRTENSANTTFIPIMQPTRSGVSQSRLVTEL
uniref:Moesin/ezrin/radixin homolog 1 n=1 Tax=Panagrellus redivivus TaxID=6233 RepID=A0A7E4VZG6_PANRE